MTKDDAKRAAIAAGIHEDQITDEILALYGYVAPAPTASVVTGPVVMPDDIKQDLLALEKEGQANQLPVQIAQRVGTVLSWARTVGFLAVLMLVLLSGCYKSTAAQQAVAQMDRSVQGLSQQHLAFEESFIGYYRTQETARIEALYADAVKSATKSTSVTVQKPLAVKIVQADGTVQHTTEIQTVTETRDVIEVNVSDALSRQRFAALQAMEQRVSEMRAQQAGICANLATFQQYSDGLKAYFQQQQVSYEALLKSQNQLLDFLKTFAQPRK